MAQELANLSEPQKHVTTDPVQHWTWFKRENAAYMFVLPGLLMYLAFFIYPFFSSIYLSLTEWDGAGVIEFVGLANYTRLINDPMMGLALKNNLIWVVIGTSVPIILALLLATILWSNARGGLIFRTIYFMPVVMSPTIIGIIWGWIYNPLIGILNRTLRDIGLGGLALGWLGDPDVALYAVLVAGIWGHVGFCVVILYAGLQNVEMELIDASKIDGANVVQRFFHIIIPQLRHVLTMVIVYTIIGGFNVFDIIYIMTRGGPANATEVIATYTYRMSFVENEVGYGASLSMVMTMLALTTALIFMFIRTRNEEASL